MKFYNKKMREVYDRCQLSSLAKINEFQNKDQHVAYLHDKLIEDEKHIQKLEIINEGEVKTQIAQASITNYIFDY